MNYWKSHCTWWDRGFAFCWLWLEDAVGLRCVSCLDRGPQKGLLGCLDREPSSKTWFSRRLAISKSWAVSQFLKWSSFLKRAAHKLELLHCVRPQGVSADGSLPRRKAGLLLRSPQVDVQPVTNRVGKVDAGTMYGTDTKKQCRSIHIGSICNHET